VLPDAVHENPRGERVIGLRQPFGEAESVARRFGGEGRQDL
jgi:hypothetical protein